MGILLLQRYGGGGVAAAVWRVSLIPIARRRTHYRCSSADVEAPAGC